MNRALRVIIGTTLILLVPLIAMFFTEEVNWTGSDFVVAAVLIGGAGFTYEFAVKRIRDDTRRTAFAIMLVAAFLLIWAELAVGIFD